MKRWMAWLWVMWAVALGSACGGGGGSDAPPVPARAGAADIGPAGGSVDAVLEGGTTVVLDVPPGALASSVTFRIDPETASPAGTLGLFTISPAGVTLLKPVAVTVTLPADVQAGPDAGLSLEGPNGAVPLGATTGAATGQFRVQLSFLSPAPAPAVAGRAFAAAAQRAQPAATGAATKARMRLEGQIDGARRNGTFLFLVDALKLQGSIDNAIVVQMAADSLAPGATSSNEISAGMRDWRDVVCPQQSFAVSALNTFNGVDVASFGRLTREALVWTLLARDMDATLRRVFNTTVPLCSGLPDDFRQPVIDRLPAFIDAVTASLDRLNARTEFDQILRARLPELIDLESLMQEFDLGPAVLNLIGEQAVRLRVAAYQACRDDGDQLPQKDLLESAPLFSVTTPFAEADIRQDVQFCGMPLRWQLKNEIGQIVGEGAAGGIAAGQTRTAVDLPLTGVSRLVLMGPLAALHCVSREPGNAGVDRIDRRQNNEQLSFGAGPLAGALTSVGLLTPSNEASYLAVSALELDVAQLRALALPAGPPGSGRLVVTRVGDVCSNAGFPNLSAHDAIVTFGLKFDSLLIADFSLNSRHRGLRLQRGIRGRGRPTTLHLGRQRPAGRAEYEPVDRRHQRHADHRRRIHRNRGGALGGRSDGPPDHRSQDRPRPDWHPRRRPQRIRPVEPGERRCELPLSTGRRFLQQTSGYDQPFMRRPNGRVCVRLAVVHEDPPEPRSHRPDSGRCQLRQNGDFD